MRLGSRIAAAGIWGFSMLAGTVLPGPAASTPDLWDKPVDVTQMKLPVDKLNPNGKPMLSCFYFPGFRVKQVDLGEIGADELTILPLKAGEKGPPCQKADLPGEKMLDWPGYFKGVKGGYVFFDADDGWNGGMGFAIIRGADGTQLVDDAAKDIHSVTLTQDGVSVRYRRVVAADCSLFAEPDACWHKVRDQMGLKDPAPQCADLYRKEQRRVPKSAEEAAKDPTVLEYEAELVLTGAAHSIAPLPGKVICRPSD